MEVNALKIKALRNERSWTQQHLADACGISLRTVQRVERYGNTSKETLMSLAAVFELAQSELVVVVEKVEVIDKVVTFDRQRERRLIVVAMSLGIIIGALVMFLLSL